MILRIRPLTSSVALALCCGLGVTAQAAPRHPIVPAAASPSATPAAAASPMAAPSSRAATAATAVPAAAQATAAAGTSAAAPAAAHAAAPTGATPPVASPPVAPTSAGKLAHAEPADPWAGRTDLFVPPTLTPTTKVTLGPVTRTTLPNGLLLIVVPRHQVPSVEVTLAVKIPDNAEPLDKGGLAQFTAAMLRQGTKTRSADQIADAIDFVGGALDAQAGSDGLYVSCHARARDTGLCTNLVSDVAMNPTFPQAEMGEVRDQLLATVNRVKDTPQALARWHAANVFYGDEDPRGRPMSKRSLGEIDQASLRSFHGQWFTPSNAILAISGDVDEKMVRALIKKTFGDWKAHDIPVLPEAPARATADPTKPGQTLPVRLVDKPDATQSALMVIGPGIRHLDPEFYATRLMNYTLGGGSFSSRLMQVVRANGGKTYGVHSSFDAGRDAGPFTVSTFTRNRETVPTLQLVLQEIAKMKATGPTSAELLAAKGNLIGGYGLRLETGEDLAGALIGAEIDGLDPKYVTDYPSRLMAVTLKDAAQAAAQHLDPQALVVVGKASEVGPQLKQAGYRDIHVVSYLDPVSSAERKAAVAERSAAAQPLPGEVAEGKRLLDLALGARGGQTALAKVQSLALTGKGTMSMQGQTMPIKVATQELRGHSIREDLDMGGMLVTQVFADGKGFVRQGDRRMDMPPQLLHEMAQASFRDPNFIILNAALSKARVRSLGPSTVDGKTYDTLEVISPTGDATRVLLDPKTHLVARIEYQTSHGPVIDHLDGYKRVDGLLFPFRVVHEAGGQKVAVDYDKIEVNPRLGPHTFE